MQSRNFRIFGILMCLVAVITLSLCCYNFERTSCLGVKIISEEEFSTFTYNENPIEEKFTFYGEPAAVDTGNKIIYISQAIDENTRYWNLDGELKLDTWYDVFFLEDSCFYNLSEAVKTGHKFALYLCNGKEYYQKYSVVFTTLPVLKIEDISWGEDVIYGDMTVWNCYDKETGRYNVQKSETEAHIRGRSSSFAPKKSWKIALKDKHGGNRDLSLLGLGLDDDYILNPLVYDDTKIREKLAMNLWNRLENSKGSALNMSAAEYVEVVRNGEYHGIHMLQRRIDGKYLELDKNDILIKQGVEWIYPQDFNAEIYDRFTEGKFNGNVEVLNFVDCELLFNFGYMIDNVGDRNIFYLINQVDEKEKLKLIPWDTDMSFGTVWSQEKEAFDYLPEYVHDKVLHRKEYNDVLVSNPNIDRIIAERWFELRKGCFSYENMIYEIENISDYIYSSGAIDRDIATWGLKYSGKDTLEGLKNFVEKRLEFLDAYYTDILENYNK